MAQETARELLKDAHRVLELLPPTEAEAILGRIGAYLGEPVHIGDTTTIKFSDYTGSFKSQSYDQETRETTYNDDVPEGLKFEDTKESFEHEGKAREFTYREWTYPEAGDARYLSEKDYTGGFVTTIHGRRYRIDLHINAGDSGDHGGAATFVRTDDPETTFETWDHAEALKSYREREVKSLEGSKAELADPETDAEWLEYTREDIKNHEKQIAEIDAGEVKLRQPFYVQVFGQPNFLQNNVFPTYGGRCAMALASVETGWGDMGNVNILFACDDDGVPCRVWIESSCH
jgi:hypothetical protein